MNERRHEIEGGATDAPGSVGLLLVDVVNPLDFEGARELAPKAHAAASRIADLRAQADALGAPVIYVNDNYGHWASEKDEIVRRCAEASDDAKKLIERLAPQPHDYFVIKPQFSGFYATNLPVLLPRLGVSRLVLCGVAADICVLFTAADAHMREYDLWVPEDAVASADDERKRWALHLMAHSMAAETAPAGDLRLADWVNQRA